MQQLANETEVHKNFFMTNIYPQMPGQPEKAPEIAIEIMKGYGAVPYYVNENLAGWEFEEDEKFTWFVLKYS